MSEVPGRPEVRADDDLTASSELAQARLQLALEATGLGLWDWDVTTDALVWDQASRRMLGVLPEHVAGAIGDIEQPIHPEDLPAVQAALDAAIESAGDVDVQYRAVWRDGSVRWIHARGRAVLDARGEVCRLIGTNVDVTESHRAHQEQLQDAARLAGLVSVAQALGSAQTEAAVLEVVNRRGVRLLGAMGAVLCLADASTTSTVRALTTSFFDDQVQAEVAELSADFPLPMVDSLTTGTAWFLSDRAAAVAAFPGAAALYEQANTQASAAVPLRAENKVLGSLSVAFDHDHPWRTPDRELVNAFASLTAQALDRIGARDAERSAILATQRLSETLQRSLLTNPPEPNHLQITARYQPAAQEAQIGGDWHDAFLTSGGVTTVVIGDVTGHDGPAAAAMAQVRNVLRGVAQTIGKPPAAVMTALDAALTNLRFGALTTAVIAQVTEPPAAAAVGQRLLHWSNAGHPPPLLITPDGRAELLWRPADPLLGLDPDSTRTHTRTNHTIVLDPGCTLVLYTDGLVERRREPLDDGLDRLLAAAADLQDLAPEQFCDALLQRLGADAEDDVALLVLRPEPAPAPGPALPSYSPGTERVRSEEGVRAAATVD